LKHRLRIAYGVAQVVKTRDLAIRRIDCFGLLQERIGVIGPLSPRRVQLFRGMLARVVVGIQPRIMFVECGSLSQRSGNPALGSLGGKLSELRPKRGRFKR
jgi:hypothetical protein